MKRLLIIAILLCNAVVAQNLPKSINVRFTKYIESHTDARVPLDSACLKIEYKILVDKFNEKYSIYNPDQQTYKDTDCEYILDLENMECCVYIKGKISGKAPIIAVKQLTPKYETEFDHWIYVVKLQDLAKETEIYIDTNTFLYTLIYHLEEEFYERVILWPLDVKININN